MNFANSKDDTLLRFYENVRDQVQADSQFGGKYRFAGDGVKQYAEELREEMEGDDCGIRRSIGTADFFPPKAGWAYSSNGIVGSPASCDNVLVAIG